MLVGKPIGEVKNKAGEQPSFGKAKQKPYDHKAIGAGCEGGSAGDDAPSEHNSRDPQARTDLLEDDIARHFEKDVAPRMRRRPCHTTRRRDPGPCSSSAPQSRH